MIVALRVKPLGDIENFATDKAFSLQVRRPPPLTDVRAFPWSVQQPGWRSGGVARVILGA
jgi:hypothetical protein